ETPASLRILYSRNRRNRGGRPRSRSPTIHFNFTTLHRRPQKPLKIALETTLRSISDAGKQRSAGIKRTVQPRSINQRKYVEAIEQNDMVFGVGPAGTGKTYLAVAMAVSAINAKKVSRIVLVRPAVEAGEKLGFLPGSLQEKVDPYLRPLYDALYDLL